MWHAKANSGINFDCMVCSGGERGNQFHIGFGVVGLPKGLGNLLMKSLATWCMELTPSGRSFLWIGSIAFLLLENQGGLRRLLAFSHCSMGSLSRLSGLRGIMMLCSTASSGISKRSRI